MQPHGPPPLSLRHRPPTPPPGPPPASLYCRPPTPPPRPPPAQLHPESPADAELGAWSDITPSLPEDTDLDEFDEGYQGTLVLQPEAPQVHKVTSKKQEMPDDPRCTTIPIPKEAKEEDSDEGGPGVVDQHMAQAIY